MNLMRKLNRGYLYLSSQDFELWRDFEIWRYMKVGITTVKKFSSMYLKLGLCLLGQKHWVIR